MFRLCRLSILTLLAALALAACDKDVLPSDGLTPFPKIARKGGRARGIVLDERGRLPNPPGGKITVTVRGVYGFGDRQIFAPKLDAEGRYDIPISDEGRYAAEAWIDLDYEGMAHRVMLASMESEPAIHGAHEGDRGIVTYFRFRISGMKPGATDKRSSMSYYGGQIHFTLESVDDGDPIPDDARLLVQLAPAGPLMDGSLGKDLAQSCTAGQLRAFDLWNDVPLGKYTMTASLQRPGGAYLPLVFPQTSGLPAPTATILFLPNPALIGTTLPAEVVLLETK